jgi:hypothetical protein
MYRRGYYRRWVQARSYRFPLWVMNCPETASGTRPLTPSSDIGCTAPRHRQSRWPPTAPLLADRGKDRAGNVRPSLSR